MRNGAPGDGISFCAGTIGAMAVFKRKYRGGKTVWCFVIDAPGSTREIRHQIKESGFSTKAAAEHAEAERRITEQQKYELQKAGLPDVPLPKTLADLLRDFFAEHAEKKLAKKTIERYREQAAYLQADLLAMPVCEINPLHLAKEWNRLLESGGRYRTSGLPRPLAAKTVRNIAGVLSSAFARAIKWGVVASNPVAQSEPPVPKRRSGAALSPSQQKLLIDSATGCWCLPAFLELSAATGARRGEVLALRWSDIQDGAVSISRSLSQTRAGLTFKETKNQSSRLVVLPNSAVNALEVHREAQNVFRDQFSSAYSTEFDLIFAEPDGTPLKPNSISASVSALFKRLKIPKPKGASLHLLRHSHGSHLLAAGMELPAVSERLGHSSVMVTATVYSHRLTGRDQEAATRWDKFQKSHEQPERKQ
jgi:integrase